MAEAEDQTESLFEAPPMAEQERMVEAILFASSEPASIKELESRMPHGCDAGEALVHLRRRYEGRGVRVVRVVTGNMADFEKFLVGRLTKVKGVAEIESSIPLRRVKSVGSRTL